MNKTTFEEIRQRKLVQWALAYLAFAWLILQVVDVLGGTYDWSAGLVRAVPVVLAVGLIGALVVAWYHGEQGRQRVSGLELGILSVLLLIAGLGVMLVGGQAGGDADDSVANSGVDAATEQASTPSRSIEYASVAVLPFENISDDDQAFFANGLTEELLATMARVPGLQIAARTSSFAFHDSRESTSAIGEALGVAHLVEGSVRKAGERVRVTARLVDADSGEERWTESYDRRIEDVFAVQEEIARSVARELRIRVGDASLTASGTESPEAYEAVLRGRAALERRDGSSLEWTTAAQRAFEQAIELDPDYAAAWGGLARVRFQKAYLDLTDDREAQFESAKGAAERALELAPQQGDALYALGVIALLHEVDYRRAADLFLKAIQANPSDARSLAFIGWTLYPLGETERALSMAERAVALDPLSLSVLNNAAGVFGTAREFERALALNQSALELDPKDVILLLNKATYASMLDKHEIAIDAIERVRSLAPDLRNARAISPVIFARAGMTDMAKTLRDQMPEDEFVARGQLAWVLGEEQRALELWERGYDKGLIVLEDFQSSPAFDSARDDPGWQSLLERLRTAAQENH